MTTVWVAHVPLSELSTLGTMRLHDGVEAMAMGDRVFVRGRCESATLPAEVRSLPGEIYTAWDDEQLVRYLHQTPTKRLPIGYWAPLREFLAVALPKACLDAEAPARVPLQMKRTANVRPSNLLVTTLDAWIAYVEKAPWIRLQPLRFVASKALLENAPTSAPGDVSQAVAKQTEVLVHGYPLPPLPGRHWVEESGVAAPAGWIWSPRLDADIVAKAFLLEPGDVALLHPVDGDQAPRVEHLDHSMFSPARRSAVRGLMELRDADESTEAP